MTGVPGAAYGADRRGFGLAGLRVAGAGSGLQWRMYRDLQATRPC